jgi:hypothetical protein
MDGTGLTEPSHELRSVGCRSLPEPWTPADSLLVDSNGGRISHVMLSRIEVESVLHAELARKKSACEATRKEFNEIISDIPSGLPQPDGTARISTAGSDFRFALRDYEQALREFNEFVLHGRIPERFKASDLRQGA